MYHAGTRRPRGGSLRQAGRGGSIPGPPRPLNPYTARVFQAPTAFACFLNVDFASLAGPYMPRRYGSPQPGKLAMHVRSPSPAPPPGRGDPRGELNEATARCYVAKVSDLVAARSTGQAPLSTAGPSGRVGSTPAAAARPTGPDPAGSEPDTSLLPVTTHPDVVILAVVLADPHWSAIASNAHRLARMPFELEVSRRPNIARAGFALDNPLIDWEEGQAHIHRLALHQQPTIEAPRSG
jgi:hypothetical protein